MFAPAGATDDELGARAGRFLMIEDRLAAAMRGALNAEFARVRDVVLSSLGGSSDRDIDRRLAVTLGLIPTLLADHPDQLNRIFVQHLGRAFDVFGEMVFDLATEIGRSGFKAADDFRPDARSTFRAARQAYLDEEGGAHIVRISDTTRVQLLGELQDAIIDGTGYAGAAAGISTVTVGEIGRFRATTIAGTEMHSASQAATYEAHGALVSEFSLVRKWVSVEDDRRRDTHRAAHGQIAPVDGTFLVGGFNLRYPGDPRGPAKEIIRCRCVAALQPPEYDQ